MSLNRQKGSGSATSILGVGNPLDKIMCMRIKHSTQDFMKINKSSSSHLAFCNCTGVQHKKVRCEERPRADNQKGSVTPMSYLELVAGEDGAECDCGGAVHGLVARPLLVAIITLLCTYSNENYILLLKKSQLRSK